MPGAKRRAVREGGSFLSRLTTRTSPAMCPPPGPLDPGAGLKVGVPGLACHVPNGRLAHRAGTTAANFEPADPMLNIGIWRGEAAPLRTPGLPRRCGAAGGRGAPPPEPRMGALTAKRRTVVVAARVTRTERAAYSEAQAHRTRGPGEPVEVRVADMFAVREVETDVRDALGPGYSSLNWID